MKEHGGLARLVRSGLAVIAALGLEAGSRANVPPLVEGNTAFALELYARMRSNEGNLIFSPYSISSALAMTYAGARGETARQMEQALHFNTAGTNLHAWFGRLNAALRKAQASGDVVLNIANSLWPRAGHDFRPEFLGLLKREYQATVTPLDYEHDPAGAGRKIARWVDEATRHKIPEIIDPAALDENTRMVLVNAVYFKGDWASPFKRVATAPGRFLVRPGTDILTPLMHHEGKFAYAEDSRLQVLELPYRGGRLSMVILLPRDPDGLPELEKELSADHLGGWTHELQKRKVMVWLPRFNFSGGFNLKPMLAGLGILDAFDDRRADFSGMDSDPRRLQIDRVVHQALIEINERGTEAAATSFVVEYAIALFHDDPMPIFRADHPFLFLIRERETGTILFLGRVVEPERDDSPAPAFRRP
jgi:serine protease inhibitor